ncbi:MAG: hypothetical protein LYZ69_03580 [Nitrososphaerales archaeon]|nr:hypothetical protein [Nitrososphaerales archaeon]
MKAVDFYVDRRMAVSSPSEYARSMQKTFGDGARVLIDGVIDDMCAAAGIERGGIASLEDCVVSARRS